MLTLPFRTREPAISANRIELYRAKRPFRDETPTSPHRIDDMLYLFGTGEGVYICYFCVPPIYLISSDHEGFVLRILMYVRPTKNSKVIKMKRRFSASKIMKYVTNRISKTHSMRKTMMVAKLRNPTAARGGTIVAWN